MKNTIKVFGIIALSAVMVCVFIACDANDPGDDDDKNKKDTPVIPVEYQDTAWEHIDGYVLKLAKNKVTVTLSNGTSATYPFTKKETINNGDVFLQFDTKKDVAGIITFRDGKVISAVFPDMGSKSGGWQKEGAGNNNQNNNNNNNVQYDDVVLNDMKFVYSRAYTGYMVTEYTGTSINITIPEKVNDVPVTAIKDGYYSGFSYGVFSNRRLTNVTIPNGVIYIGVCAFHNNQLTSVTIPNSVTTIGNGAFNENQLTSVTIPNSVTTIGDGAFSKNQLTSVTIPNSVTEIGNEAFYKNQLTSVTIPNSVTEIEVGAFSNNQLTSVTIPNSVTEIKALVFANNPLTSVTIPNSIIYIRWAAFYGNKLTSLTIGNSVTSIGSDVFGQHSQNLLKSITIGSNVELGEGGENHSFDNGFDNYYNICDKAAGTYTRPDTSYNTWTKQ